jgi:hypothetical protein
MRRVVEGDYQELDIVPRDAKDNPIATAALEGQVSYLVSQADDRRAIASVPVTASATDTAPRHALFPRAHLIACPISCTLTDELIRRWSAHASTQDQV